MTNFVFKINNYREACKFLQKKYDDLGFERFDYYKVDSRDGHLIKNTKVGHGKDGLQYHHICEDIVPSLSDKSRAEANPIEYQKAKNMCYCNLLEHAWLHILIAEQSDIVADNDQSDLTGQGGVKWMMLALNSIMCNADLSWYSSKNEEGKGCNYNYNSIITDNRDIWLKIINRYCTSAFIRQRFNKRPEDLLRDICILCKKDGSEGGKLSIYNELRSTALNTKLFEYNVGAFADLMSYLNKEQTALVYICTGGGKTTTALEYLRLVGGKALILGPGDIIKTGWEAERNWKDLGASADVVNYQTFMDTYKTTDFSQYSVIICDEAHHLDAERWGEGVVHALHETDLKIIGLTATPTTKQFEGTDKLFGKRICYGLDLAEGIENNIIYPFDYIQSIYKMADMKSEFDKYGSTGTLLWERLNVKMNENPIEKILKKHMPKNRRKIIVFCSSIDMIDDAKEIIIKYDPKFSSTDYMRILVSKDKDDAKDDTKNWFDDKENYSKDIHNKCLLTVGMVNEGAHYDGINTLIMFRKTNSSRLYLQQLGRIVMKKPEVNPEAYNPEGVVFDFTNNAEHLIYSSDYATYTGGSRDKQADIEAVKRIKKALSGKEVICQDYTEDCVATLNALKAARDKDTQAQHIYQLFEESAFEIKQDVVKVEDWLNIDLWEELKTKGKAKKAGKTEGTSGLKLPPIHAASNETNSTIRELTEEKSDKSIKKTVDATLAQKLTHIFTLGLRRCYGWNYIDFKDDSTCSLTVNNEAGFDKVWEDLGFKKVDILRSMITKFGNTQVYLIATSLS